jgi:hypothetical protein
MSIYIILIICLLLLSNSKKGILSFIILFLISGFRDISVGTDTINYSRIFENPNSFERINDFIWIYLNSFFLEQGLSFHYILIIATFIFLLMIYLTALKMKVNVGLSFFYLVSFFFYFQSFNITRQLIAASIILYAFTFIIDRKLLFFLLFVFIASGFHFSAIFVAPFYFISNKSYKPALVIPLLFSSYLVGGLITISDILGKINLNIVYSSLLDSTDDLNLGFSISRFFLNVYVSYLVLRNKGNSLLINLLIVGVLILNLLAPFGYISRFAYYFMIVQVVLLPEYQLMRNKRLHVISVLYSLVIFFYLLINNNGGIYPYKVSNYFFGY